MDKELRLSVSKTKCFKQCKKQFEFAYVKKLPKKDRDYHIFGKFCHKVLEDFHNAYLVHNSQENYNKIMSVAFKAAQAEFKDGMTPEMTKECFAIISQYLKLISVSKKNKSPGNVIACEKNFNLEISDKIILNGMVDRIQIDDDNVIHVADYKTTKNKKYLKNDWFQLLTYAYVILSENPDIDRVRASYILLRHDCEFLTTEFKTEEILSIKDEYIKYAEDIHSENEYKANPSPLCDYCDFLDFCDEGKAKANPMNVYGEVKW